MKPKVTVIDYGIGNLLSVSRAFEFCGASVELTDSKDKIANAERLVLPGVGAFADGMDGLANRGLIEPIKELCSAGRPFLGICLGMQMMLDTSEEFGIHQGLGLIPGKVIAIPNTGNDGQPHRIPHIGWNDLIKPEHQKSWENTILEDVEQGDSVYFVHSYGAVPENNHNQMADCDYNGRIITAVIRKGNIYGSQFHPEKSGKVGLKIIENFLKLG